MGAATRYPPRAVYYSNGLGIGFGLFFLVFFGLAIAGAVFWIIKIIEVAKIPEDQFRVIGSEKTAWLLVVVLAGWIGALVWQFAKRSDVLRAAAYTPRTPAGWYPEPGTGILRWWDGYRWTEHTQSAQHSWRR